jgi:DNA-binding LacI/PurR family transcriptional regulator
MADNVRGIEQAVDHLVERSRRRIGLVNSSTLTKTSEEKLRGLRLGAQKHGLQLADSQTISSLDFNLESGYRQTRQLLDQSPDLDAIIYGHDVMAMGGLRALKERGIRVPDDVAVVGFHDYEIAQFTDPPLTTVAFDTQLMGMMAARRLRMMLDDPDGQNWLMFVPTTLVIRAST